MLDNAFRAFGLSEKKYSAVPFGTGLINHTWKVTGGNTAFILQRINQHVFKNPMAIAHNIRITSAFLAQHHPDYLFVRPEKSADGHDLYFDGNDGYFRLMTFVSNSHTVDVVADPGLAYEAAMQFGKFTRLLCGFDTKFLQITLPDFHNLSLRYQQFELALSNGNQTRIQQSRSIIDSIIAGRDIVHIFENIWSNPAFKIRVTHHDTKISNVLFDKNNKGLCVIDLDTLMPGYFISDVGDMLRTYLSPVSEEEKDFSKIEIREDYFRSIVKGYLGELNGELTSQEKKHFVYAGKFMIYMQAMRFLTDYLNNDVYYGSAYESHNFIRAGNQLSLLVKLTACENKLQKIVEAYCMNHAINSPVETQQ